MRDLAGQDLLQCGMVLGRTRSAECLKLYVATAASTTYRPCVLGKVQKVFRYFTAPWRQNHWAVVSRKCLGELVHCGVLPDRAHVFRSRYAALDSSSGSDDFLSTTSHVPSIFQPWNGGWTVIFGSLIQACFWMKGSSCWGSYFLLATFKIDTPGLTLKDWWIGYFVTEMIEFLFFGPIGIHGSW